MSKWDFITKKLATAEKTFLKRTLRQTTRISPIEVIINNQRVIDFSSNNYLGLTHHPAVIKRAQEYLIQKGAGSSSSRLICGNLDCYEDIEKKIAHLKGKENALIFSSGYLANCSIIASLADAYSLIIMDKFCHNSLIQGSLLSQAKILRFNHNDYHHLKSLLLKHRNHYAKVILITESIFSMDGDTADLDKFSQIAEEFSCISYVDEAHATGVIGIQGMGLSVGKKIDLVMGTFSKALGSYGAYIACSHSMKEYLINFCPGLIYTTSLPPSVLGAIDSALDLIPSLNKERTLLQDNALFLRTQLNALGMDTALSSTQIVPLITGEEKLTNFLSAKLLEEKILGISIRPPTVPKGNARIRFSLTALHTKEHITILINALKKYL